MMRAAPTVLFALAILHSPPGVLAQNRVQAPDSLVPRPVAPLVRRDVCPFECCTYRQWSARSEIPVYATEGDTTSVAFTIATSQPFNAITGNVHLAAIGLVVIHRPVETRSLLEPATRVDVTLQPGDSLSVLDYLGEGFFSVWHAGRIGEMEAFWRHLDAHQYQVDLDFPRPGPAWTILSEPDPRWWVRIETLDGQTGWIDLREARVTNHDACG